VARTFLIAGIATLVLALVAGAIVAARTAAPIRRIAGAAGGLGAEDLSRRVPVGGSTEVRQLAMSFNRMLSRLEGAFARQRRFASDASHELRTPLTAIRGQIEVLAMAESPSRVQIEETVQRVTREVSRLDRLVGDLLLLAQSDEGTAPLKEPIDVGGFVTETLEAVSRGAGRHVQIAPLVEGELAGDPDRLAQVLRNLVENAIQHAGPDGLVVVSATAIGERLRIMVDDDGPGIPPSERDAVFDRFHRTDASRARRTGGSGLGLAIARAIVDAHGGRIWADEAPIGGARVAFELPGFRRAVSGETPA
jgi:signal transduction histidine kinase